MNNEIEPILGDRLRRDFQTSLRDLCCTYLLVGIPLTFEIVDAHWSYFRQHHPEGQRMGSTKRNTVSSDKTMLPGWEYWPVLEPIFKHYAAMFAKERCALLFSFEHKKNDSYVFFKSQETHDGIQSFGLVGTTTRWATEGHFFREMKVVNRGLHMVSAFLQRIRGNSTDEKEVTEHLRRSLSQSKFVHIVNAHIPVPVQSMDLHKAREKMGYSSLDAPVQPHKKHLDGTTDWRYVFGRDCVSFRSPLNRGQQ